MKGEPAHRHLSADIPEHDGEPVTGLPEALPAGETMLWQGRPETVSFAVRALGLRGLSLYFGGLLLLQAGIGFGQGGGLVEVGGGLVISAAIGLTCLALLWFIGRAAARATIYTITDKRVVFRVGIALPMVINLPFTVIGSVARAARADGTEDVELTIVKPASISWVALWPHVQFGSILRAKPVLRALPQKAGVAQLLARALAGSAGAPVQQATDTTDSLSRPANVALAG
ncbi:MAG: PH domain-containing protein [Rubritepida sp.]|nr:PH domain-containing protein [Rubritepida sp.]